MEQENKIDEAENQIPLEMGKSSKELGLTLEEEEKEDKKQSEAKSSSNVSDGGEKEQMNSNENEQDNPNRESLEDLSNNKEDNASHQLSMEEKFTNLTILYKYKLKALRNLDNFMEIYKKFWELLPHTFEGEITKETFIMLFVKIYKLILPIFNYPNIEKFTEGLWIRFSMEKNTMSQENFSKALFKVAHEWCIHVNKYEYEDFLNMIYNRITRIRKYFPDGTEKIYYPSIKVDLYSPLLMKDYTDETYERFKSPDEYCRTLYEEKPEEKEEDEKEEKKNEDNIDENQENIMQGGNEPENKNTFARPKLYYTENENSLTRYDPKYNFLIYNEETFYLDQEEIEKIDLNECTKYELIDDNELVIFGYPTQFIISKFYNNKKLIEDIEINDNSDYDSYFFITDYKPYEQFKIFLKIHDKEALVNFLGENKFFILYRDIIRIKNFPLGVDFEDDELNVPNNLKRNIVFDRYVSMYEIKVAQTNTKIFANLESLIMNPTFKKAFENVKVQSRDQTVIGTQSILWNESIEDKLEKIILTKFYLIYEKLQNVNLNYIKYEQIVDEIKKEKSEKINERLEEANKDLLFFDKFKSKMGIKFDNWNSDNDLYDEANKKSPIVLIVGPPLIGKTSISQKLAKDLDMVYLEPTIFFDNIFKKVADFEEKMANWDENEGAEEPQEEGDDKKEPPKKKVKPGLDSALTKLEFDVYNDITVNGKISEVHMRDMFNEILHSELAKSRGVVIDMNSNIFPKNEDKDNDDRCFVEKLFSGYYGNAEVDYIVDLTINKSELIDRKNKLRFNLKNLKNISPREIELMQKPKIAKKEILEDEIEYDEEGKPVVPEPEPEPELGEEELEKIPKKEDLIEITDLDQIFNEQYEYYENEQYPLIIEYAEKLKKNYYMKVDVTGLDFDEVTELIKCRLDFANPMRPIPKILEGGDHKSLLMEGRDGILPYRRWSPWKQIDPVALKDDFLLLTGSVEFAADYFSRVFLFVSDENRKKFIQNPKKYLNAPPQVPINYRVSIIGPPKSGKSTIAEMLSKLYGWRVIDMEEIYDNVKDYQQNWAEPEINSVYTTHIHFSANEFKEVLANAAKKADKKADNFTSKIVFMCDSLGIPLDKRKTKEEFFNERKYHNDKLNHLFTRMREAEERIKEEENDKIIKEQEDKIEKERLEAEAQKEVEIFPSMTECARSMYEIEKDARAQVYIDKCNQKAAEKEKKAKELELKEAQNPFPPEEDYAIEDLRSDQFWLAFDNDGNQPRVNGIILMNHPFSDDECTKLKDFNIVMDRIVYIHDESEEGLKAYAIRKNPNFENLNEEKQAAELEKVKGELTKYDEVMAILKEKYSVNNEEAVIEVGYNEPIEQLKLKLINFLNPFSVKVDTEDKVVMPADVPAEEKYPLSRGPFGLFCPVIYKEDNWLFYSPEANEVLVNQRVYRLSGEKEMEKFRADPAKYLGENGSQLPIQVPPPHIMITGYQGAGITFFSNVLCKDYKMTKRELQNEFMQIWEKQKMARKQIRIDKKKEELRKQNEEIEQKNADALKENPEAEKEPLVDIDEAIANDAALDDEGEDYNAVDNDKEIFKNLFDANSATIYDASWNGMEEKVSTPFIDLLSETRRVPNVMVVLKVSMKTIMDRHFHLDQIEAQYEEMLKASNEKRKQREADLIKQKQQEKYDQLKEEIENENQNEEGGEGENNEEGGEGENNEEVNEGENKEEGENNEGEDGEPKKKKKKKRKLPDINSIKIELEQEEKDDIWNSPDPDLIEKDALIQQEKDKLSQRYENNVNSIQTLIDTLKERGIPVIEINNDSQKEKVYKNILLELKPYIMNRKNLIEKQLVNNKKFPNPLMLRTVRNLYTNSQIYLQSVYGLHSPVHPNQLCIRTDYPLVYRDRVYMFNAEEEKDEFCEYPLDYRSTFECPKDAYPMRGRTIIYVIGQLCSGKTTLSKLISKYVGYKRITVRKACLDLLEKLHDCELKREIENVLYNGQTTSDQLLMKILERRVTMNDLVNEDIVIDGFPYTIIQANLLDNNLKPDLIFVTQFDTKKNIDLCLKQKMFKGIPEVVNERNKQRGGYFEDILNLFKSKHMDIRYFNMSLSKWAIKDMIFSALETRKKYEMKFARNLSLDKPCEISGFAPKKLIDSILFKQKEESKLLNYSPVGLKEKEQFNFNKCKNNSTMNNIIYTPIYDTKFHLLTNDEEVTKFNDKLTDYVSYISTIDKGSDKIVPPLYLSDEGISRLLYYDKIDDIKTDDANEEEGEEPDSPKNDQNDDEENGGEENEKESSIVKLSLGANYEFKDLCPVTLLDEKLKRKGKVYYSAMYKGHYFKFASMDKMKTFRRNPNKYYEFKLPRKIIHEEEKEPEKQVQFNDTVEFLQSTFSSLITKGMLEISRNKIKYPYLNVKESTLKYLALFLKANNPKNNDYARKKYNEILKEFVKNAKLPFELYSVYQNYQKEKDNPLRKQLIRKQLDTVAVKYDLLMEKAKAQNNKRFENFFRRDFDFSSAVEEAKLNPKDEEIHPVKHEKKQVQVKNEEMGGNEQEENKEEE